MPLQRRKIAVSNRKHQTQSSENRRQWTLEHSERNVRLALTCDWSVSRLATLISPSDHLFPATVLKGTVRVCMDLVTHHTCAHYTPVLREKFFLTLYVLNLFWGCWVRCSMWTDAVLFVFFWWDSWPYLVVTHTLWRHMSPKFRCYLI